jgi:hypothetical protein
MTVVRMHSALNKRMIVSIRALLNASPTLPMEGRMPSRIKMLGEPDETCDAVRVSKPRGFVAGGTLRLRNRERLC